MLEKNYSYYLEDSDCLKTRQAIRNLEGMHELFFLGSTEYPLIIVRIF